MRTEEGRYRWPLRRFVVSRGRRRAYGSSVKSEASTVTEYALLIAAVGLIVFFIKGFAFPFSHVSQHIEKGSYSP